MKRLITVFLAMCLMIASVAVLTSSITAAEILEGDWVTSRAADAYEEGVTDYTPAAGYYYTTEGFQTTSPDFTNCMPYIQVHTRTPYNLKDNNASGDGNALSVKFTITEYSYDGWIAITLNSEPMAVQGNVNYGSGLCILMRGSGNGVTTGQPHSVDKDNKGFYEFTRGVVHPALNDKGQEVYTFSIRHDGNAYVMSLCGVDFVDPTGDLDKILDEKCANGAYLGISLLSSVVETPASLLINEFQSQVPYGEDSAEPERNVTKVAELIDSANVPAGQPAIKWDSKMEQYSKVSLNNGDYVIQENGLITIVANSPNPFINFGLNTDYTYEASDFPYLAVLYKNCRASSGRFYYMSGKTLGVGADNHCDFSIDEINFGEGWGMSVVDLTDDPDWEGKMNGLRIDFYEMEYNDDVMKSFDIAYFGAFRTAEDAEQYAKDYLIALLGKMPETEAPTTEEPATEAPTTEASTTEAPAGESEVTTDAAEAPKKSCGAVVAAPVVALVAMLGVAFVAKKKD